MNWDIVYFTLYFFSSLFFLLSIVYLTKYKRFQDSRTLDSTNTYILGLACLTLYLFINSLSFGGFIIKKLMPSFFNTFLSYVGFLSLAANLVLGLLVGICFLISVILLKEADIR